VLSYLKPWGIVGDILWPLAAIVYLAAAAGSLFARRRRQAIMDVEVDGAGLRLEGTRGKRAVLRAAITSAFVIDDAAIVDVECALAGGDVLLVRLPDLETARALVAALGLAERRIVVSASSSIWDILPLWSWVFLVMLNPAGLPALGLSSLAGAAVIGFGLFGLLLMTPSFLFEIGRIVLGTKALAARIRQMLAESSPGDSTISCTSASL
jgi:hypothetical protein